MNLEFRDSESCREAGITYHMAAVDEWEAQKDSPQYAPAQFADEGFIHCTDGLDLLTQVGNMFYKADDRPRTVLILDRNKLSAPVRYDDEDELFPHVYGQLDTAAVVGELQVVRAKDGTFQHIGSM